MNVLSVFDGISCGQYSLKQAGIKIDKYYSSEIDKYAMQVTNNNFPNTIQLGDARDWKSWDIEKPDIIMAGFPCQSFSVAGNRLYFKDSRGQLFFTLMDILRFYNPKYFIIENVKIIDSIVKLIDSEIGVEHMQINSSLVSAQNRVRYYWTNIPEVTQPEDLDISFRSILDNSDAKDVSVAEMIYMLRRTKGGRNHFEFNYAHNADNYKSNCVLANMYRGVPYNVCIERSSSMTCKRFKTYEVTNNQILVNNEYHRIKIPDGNYIFRKLTPVECERLQTLPDNYTAGISNTQRYKCIGNSWTSRVISHILGFIK
jgi:DNA-cytosine methyltransferase